MTNPSIDCMTMLNAIRGFVIDFNQSSLYENFGTFVGQSLLDEFGASLCNLGANLSPYDAFYEFVVKVKFMPGNVYPQVNTVFGQYYQGALNFNG